MNNDNYLTTIQVAEELDVAVETVYSWIKKKELVPVHEDWRIDNTKLFRKEDVQTLKDSRKKPGYTSGDIANKLDMPLPTVKSYLNKGIIKSFKQVYRGLERYFVTEEELENFIKSELYIEYKDAKQFYLVEDKEYKYFLYQRLVHPSNGAARITKIDGSQVLITTEDGEVLPISEAEKSGYVIEHPIELKKYIGGKKGYATFSFTKPRHISSPIYALIELLYQYLGPRNIKVSHTESDIVVKVKPILLPLNEVEHSKEVSLLESNLVEGKIINRNEDVYIDSDLKPVPIYLTSNKKQELMNQAKEHNTSLEAYLRELIEIGEEYK
ncbi:helix-turn-helix domain-containing protein [Anaerobacillus sp. 1_MG-2023]|uniref:helix-turn-helix domain-containing protein n=1 Tax=Anaerobacillus sp. 1_MG-2023 TaxID=3062655 RepID=UPI0026E1A504|nr:helix-turn-helix domain-containing protein [Anaerobacillus sp. 1_MG-2023]MDO6657481.1 helix-turn-helix domain-containing protein [Anaerobacillus sp. 1_MG-2023]